MPSLQALEGVPSRGGALGEALGSGLSQGISAGINQMFQKREGTALAEYLGQPEMASALGALPKDMQMEVAKAYFHQNQAKQQEKQNQMQVGLQTIEQMRSLIPSAGPSNWVQGLFPGETQKKRAELESLGRSLIPLVAAGVPIRNQREFDEYRKIITNPNSQQSDLEGALNGIQSVLERSIAQSGNEQQASGGGQQTAKSGKESPLAKVEAGTPLTRDIATQILKRSGGDKNKARKAAKQLGYEWQ
jgi:hypothetical protein